MFKVAHPGQQRGQNPMSKIAMLTLGFFRDTHSTRGLLLHTITYAMLTANKFCWKFHLLRDWRLLMRKIRRMWFYWLMLTICRIYYNKQPKYRFAQFDESLGALVIVNCQSLMSFWTIQNEWRNIISLIRVSYIYRIQRFMGAMLPGLMWVTTVVIAM